MADMDDAKYRAVIRSELRDADAFIGGDLSLERAKALDLYLQEPFGNEVEGQSTVVTAEVMEAVEWALPELLKIFTATAKAVEFEPQGPEDEEHAKQATDYANHVFYVDNDGFMIFYTAFKDALIQRAGYTKAWWHVQPKVKKERHTGLTLGQVQALLEPTEDGEEVEVAEQRDYTLPSVNPETGQPEEVPVYDVVLKRTRQEGRIRIENVPPEEMLFSRNGRTLDTLTLTGHRKTMTVQEWVRDFEFDRDRLVKVSGSGRTEFSYEQSRRRQTSRDFGGRSGEAPVEDLKEVTLNHIFLWIDKDGDGVPELRAIWCDEQATEIFEDEEVEDHPFDQFCPIPMPHQLVGLGMADQAGDLQFIGSTLLRQGLNNIYQMNNARTLLSNKVNVDDYLTNRIGGFVRVDTDMGDVQGHAVPMVTSDVGGFVYPMLERIETMKEQRTGVVRMNQGVDADTLQHDTAKGIAMMQGAGNQRIELIARIFAQTGVRSLFRRILRLMVNHQDKARTIRLRNEWVEMDPRSWNADMDLKVNVGLGYENKDQEAMMAGQVLATTQQIIAMQGGLSGPLVSAKHAYNAIKGAYEAWGEDNPDDLVMDPDSPEAQQMAAQQAQKPDPKVVEIQEKAKADVQIAQMKTQSDAQAAQMKAQNDMQLAREQAALEIQLKREIAQLDAQTKIQIAQISAQASIEQARLNPPQVRQPEQRR